MLHYSLCDNYRIILIGMLVTNHIPLFAVINNLSSAFTREKLVIINRFLSFPLIEYNMVSNRVNNGCFEL